MEEGEQLPGNHGSTSPRSSIAATGSLPFGDGKVASSPRVGYLDSCQQKFPAGAPGAVAAPA